MNHNLKLSPETLSSRFDLALIQNPTHAGHAFNIIGQDRALSALQFGTQINSPGYNIFVMAEPGWRASSLVSEFLQKAADSLPVPSSFAYVENFQNPKEPRLLKLSPVLGNSFCQDIENLIEELMAVVPFVFISPNYRQKKSAVENAFQQACDNAIGLVKRRATAFGIAVLQEDEVVSFRLRKNNKLLTEDQIAEMPESEQALYKNRIAELEDYLAEVFQELPLWRKALIENINRLNQEVFQAALTPIFTILCDKYDSEPDIRCYLDALKLDLNKTLVEIFNTESGADAKTKANLQAAFAKRYLPNLIVDNSRQLGAPVVYEPNPAIHRLFGRIEYSNQQGVLSTNYRGIQGGALAKANGGYLILDAKKLLELPDGWEALKRALQMGRLFIESGQAEEGLSIESLQPEAIPLEVKVILIGAEEIYYLFEEIDNEFNSLFKILADFEPYIPLNSVTLGQFAGLVQSFASKELGQKVASEAIARIVEQSCRQAEHQQQLSANIQNSLDILSEAYIYSCQAKSKQINKAHVEEAITAREFRNGRLSQEVLDEMLDGTLLIDTEGGAAGKINGLTIIEIGGCSFGAPARITATVYPGSRGIIDVEKEAELGQSIHSKGVLILTGYLGHRYAQQFPLAISASVAIEQSYGFIDGDSASLAELCCLISALTSIPVRQSFAVTGSVNQYGEVQAVSGVNEKIEGFFRLCKARGLNQRHAVIIPAVNQRNLMLNEEVVEAVRTGLFSVYAVATVDQTLELLTGWSAGEIDEQGNYPPNSINERVVLRLKEISDLALDEDQAKEENA